MWFWISFLLLGILVYFPIACFILLFIVKPITSALEKSQNPLIGEYFSISSIILLLIAAFLAHGGLFGWYDKLEKPTGIVISVDDEVKNDFYNYEETDGTIYLTVSDKNFSAITESHLINNGNIRFDVENDNAKKERAHLKWEIDIDGKTYQRNTLPAGTEIHIFSDSFSLKTGENIVKITAENDLGKFTKTITIYKLAVEIECLKSENAEISLCQQFIEANLADAEKAKDTATKQSEKTYSTPTYNFESESLNGTTNTLGCSYEKYGKCWDDVIEQADNDGWADAYLYGDNFYAYPNYRGCEDDCADIYDDAYWSARDYGRDSRRY